MVYLDLFFMFFKIGLFTIGGGYAMIPLIQQELVGRGLLTLEEITNVIAISEMTPGPFSVNAATFVGMRMLGLVGAFACTFGVIAPSILIMTIVALFFFNINKKAGVQAVLYGVRPVVWALIIYATITVAQSVLMKPGSIYFVDIPSLVLFAIVFCCMKWVKRISPIVFIFSAGVIGAAFLK